MGTSHSKGKNNSCEKEVESLKGKIRLLKKEINDIIVMRENDNQHYTKELMVFAFKEAEWKGERRKLREEVKKLRTTSEERIRGMEKEKVGERGTEKEWQLVGNSHLEQMREERTLRDEAVERWKRLYLAIKNELDDLIQRTNQGEGLYWRAEEEGLLEELKMELKAKEETIELLQAQLASLDQERSRWEREVDILRQSLRIMSYNYKQKPRNNTKGFPRSLPSKIL